MTQARQNIMINCFVYNQDYDKGRDACYHII